MKLIIDRSHISVFSCTKFRGSKHFTKFTIPCAIESFVSDTKLSMLLDLSKFSRALLFLRTASVLVDNFSQYSLSELSATSETSVLVDRPVLKLAISGTLVLNVLLASCILSL